MYKLFKFQFYFNLFKKKKKKKNNYRKKTNFLLNIKNIFNF